MTVVRAHWAYWSKESGDQRDYRVLTCSTGTPSQFTAAVHAENPGTPRTEESGRPESLPWVVFGCRDDGADAYCNVAVMDWTDHTDWTNRQVTATTWVTVPYGELRSRGTEYADLYEAVRAASLDDGMPTDLDLPDASAHAWAPATGDDPSAGPSAGPSARMLYWAAGVAALMLEGRVVVTGVGGAGVAERVAAIDAVARMLPYGYRAGLTACTWTPVPEQARQRLCFGDYVGDDLVRVPWDRPVPQPSGPVARRYLDLLIGHLDAGEGDRVLLWLRQNARSRPFSEPHRALEVLEALTLAETVLGEVRAGQGDADRVLKALNQKGVEAFDEEARLDLFVFLFDRRDPGLYPGMALYPCRELNEAALSALHAALAPTAPGPAAAAAEAEASAIVKTFVPPVWDWEFPEADAFAARLLAVPHEGNVPNALVGMWLERFAADPKRDWPQTGKALLRTPPVGLAAVRRCADEWPKAFNGLIAMLSRAGSAPWLTVLQWAINLPDAVAGSARTLAQAVQQCPGVAVEAFRMATAYGRLDALPLPLWQEWLRTATDERLPDHAGLGGKVANHGPRRGDAGTPGSSARLGLLRCQYGREFTAPTAATATQYVWDLADACKLLRHESGARLQELSVGMLRSTLRAHRTQPGSGPLTVAVLLGALDRAGDLGPRACGVLAAEALDGADTLRPEVQNALAAEPGGESRQRLAEIPELARAVRLGQLEQDVRLCRPATELAAHWAWLQARHPHPTQAKPDERIQRALHPWPGLRRPGEMYDLLFDVRSALVHDYRWPARQADAWIVRTGKAVLANEWLGRQAADHLRRTVTEQRDGIRASERRESFRAEEQLLTAMLGDSPAHRAAGSAPTAPPPTAPGVSPRRPAAGYHDPAPGPGSRAGRGPRFPDWPRDPWYRRRRTVWMIAAAAAVAALVPLLLFVTGFFDSTERSPAPPPAPPASTAPVTPGRQPANPPADSPANPSGNQSASPSGSSPASPSATVLAPTSPAAATTPLQGSLAPPAWLVLLAVLVAVGALFYRRPRWTGQLTMRTRRDAGPGYQVAGVLIADRLGRALPDGRPDTPGLLQLPHTTARVKVGARRSWLHPRRIDLLVQVRLADSGRRDTVRCPVGGRRMVLGLDMRHDPEAQEPLPPRPEAPPPTSTTPYPYPPPQSSPTVVAPFPPVSPPVSASGEQAPTVELPPHYAPRPRPRDPHATQPFNGGDFSGGPETGGPGRWPPG